MTTKSYPHVINTIVIFENYAYFCQMAMIYNTESCKDIAKKIWERFEVGESCAIFGFVRKDLEEKLIPKGEIILKEIERLDMEENIRYVNLTKKQRKYVYRPNSIGGPIMQKIFTWEKRIVDSEIRYTIWRFQ